MRGCCGWAAAEAEFAAVAIVVHRVAPVWVVMPAEAELVVAVGAAGAESVEPEPVD